MKIRTVLVVLALAAIAGCGYKGDLVAPDHRDEKAGQVEPDPVEPAPDPPG